MKPIIVPTDFSPTALSAVNYAADMALALDAALILLHVYQVPVSVTETTTILVPVEEMEENAERRLESLKNDLRHITSDKLEITTEARLGDVTEELEQSCNKNDPFIVIMGTTGHGAFERSIFGSTTLSVIKHLEYPVLTVPKGTEYGKGIKKIGLAWDFVNENELTAAPLIVSIVKLFGASLHVLHVEFENSNLPADHINPVLQQSLVTVKPTYHHLHNTELGEGINSYTEKNNLDLLITLPRKHTFFDSLFNKNSTRELLQVTHIPVLCIHA
ncbi:MAG: universal stress protein [Chitinophagaceae bacterium]